MKHAVSKTLFALVVTALSQIAAAGDNGFYVLGAAGLTDTSGRKSQIDTTIVNSGVTTFTSRADEKDTGYKLQFGYRFNKNLAVEGGYMDLGRYTYNAVATVPAATRDTNGKIDAWNLDVVGSLPLGEAFSLFGKLGVAAHQIKAHCDGTGIACPNPDRRARGNSLHYGLGLEWTFAARWFVRGEYDVVKNVGDAFDFNGSNGTSREDVKMGSVGLGYRF